MSDDGRHAVTVIGFVGSVFSPYYALARRRTGVADPADHVAINVALYGPGGRWAMTERGRSALSRASNHLAVGPSSMAWTGEGLEIRLDEIGLPLPLRVRGTIRLRPAAVADRVFSLDGLGRHRWRAIAPVARIEVDLSSPALSWTGSGYLDHNAGDEPLEAGFSSWTWTRTSHGAGTDVCFALAPRRGGGDAFSVAYGTDGGARIADAPTLVPSRGTGWALGRSIPSEDPAAAAVLATYEDTPFYARSLIRARVHGRTATGVHESLSLDRFRSPLVQAMLPFRMPRRTAWR